MEKIRNLLKVNHILTNNELKYILYHLSKIYGLDSIDLVVNKDIKHMMAYDIDKNIIYINWERIANNINDSRIVAINYMLLFSLIHELHHALQIKRIKEVNDYISYVYKVCFSYIGNNGMNLITELKKKIYVDSHDLFPTEVNADVMSHLEMLKLLKRYDGNYYDMYKLYLMDRVLRLYRDNEFSKFYRDVLGIDDSRDAYSIEDSIRYGIPTKKQIKDDDILKLIM